MKSVCFELLNRARAGDGVTIRGSEWYMFHVDYYGLCLYKCVDYDGIDSDHCGRLKVVGVDMIC